MNIVFVILLNEVIVEWEYTEEKSMSRRGGGREDRRRAGDGRGDRGDKDTCTLLVTHQCLRVVAIRNEGLARGPASVHRQQQTDSNNTQTITDNNNE